MIFFTSQGARNCPFFIFTGLPVFEAERIKSVCLQRKAGICKASSTSAAGLTSSAEWTSDMTAISNLLLTSESILSPFSIPGPR
jgi:hypothetical protein